MLLTSSDNDGSTSTGLCSASTESKDITEPAASEFISVAIEVGHKSAGRLELAQLACIRRVANCEDRFKPSRRASNGTTVNKDVEASPSTVGAMTTFTDTTEWEGRNVQCGIIDGRTARTSSGKD
jgi:hypothetical protein